MSSKNSNPTYALSDFIKCLHFYIGLLIGPFIFIAALTGTLYVLSPQIEQIIYKQQLTTNSQVQGLDQSKSHSLQTQVTAARESLVKPLQLKALRPSPAQGQTTRVLFIDPALDRYRAHTVFVDPVTLNIQGNLPSYGTSGILPFRIYLDFMHSDLLLGSVGRYYSELAASWMWVAAVSGIFLWLKLGRRRNIKTTSQKQTKNTKNGFIRSRTRHANIAIYISLGLIFFSATGLTWSKWAGANISQLRQDIGWITPSVSRQLSTPSINLNTRLSAQDNQFDQVLLAARKFGIDANKIEIIPSINNKSAWLVREIDHSWPTQVDSVAVDTASLTVIDHAEFKDFPLIAKLIRWGVDAHMGVLFGVINQLILAAFGIALCAVIIYGYKMLWQRRRNSKGKQNTLTAAWLKLSKNTQITLSVITIILGYALPLIGVSLFLFCMIDLLRWRSSKLTLKTAKN